MLGGLGSLALILLFQIYGQKLVFEPAAFTTLEEGRVAQFLFVGDYLLVVQERIGCVEITAFKDTGSGELGRADDGPLKSKRAVLQLGESLRRIELSECVSGPSDDDPYLPMYAISPDGSRIAWIWGAAKSAAEDGPVTLRVARIDDGREVFFRELAIRGEPDVLQFSSEGLLLYSEEPGVVQAWDLDEEIRRGEFRFDLGSDRFESSGTFGAAISFEEAKLALGLRGKGAFHVDKQFSATQDDRGRPHAVEATALALSSSGIAAVGSSTGTLSLTELSEEGEPAIIVRDLPVAGGRIRQLAFFDEGTVAAAGNFLGVSFVDWEPETTLSDFVPLRGIGNGIEVLASSRSILAYGTSSAAYAVRIVRESRVENPELLIGLLSLYLAVLALLYGTIPALVQLWR